MLPSDIHYWTRAQPFHPFRIVMNAGGTYDVFHPDLVAVMKDALVYFTRKEEDDFFTAVRMLGLQLIDRIEPIDPPTDVAEKPAGKGKKK